MSLSTYDLLFPEELQEQALCAQTNPILFISDRCQDANAARRICAMCPVREECLEWAVEHKERYGVWGGVSERKRQAMIFARFGPEPEEDEEEEPKPLPTCLRCGRPFIAQLGAKFCRKSCGNAYRTAQERAKHDAAA